MTSTPVTLTAPARPALSRTVSLFATTVRCEIARLLRVPAFVIPTILFPIMFFTLFGLPNIGLEIVPGVKAGPYMLAAFGAYSMLSAALFSFGTSIATERGLGWNRLLRVTPMKPGVYLLAKAVNALIIGLITLLALFAFAAVAGHVTMTLGAWLSLLVRLLGGMIPFIALGLWIGYFGGPNSASPITNLIFLPMSFASGLFVPIHQLPKFVQDIAPYLPAYHSGNLAWDAVGGGDGKDLIHLAWLVGYTVFFLLIALIAYRKDEGKNFG
ncbi:MAG TPA: ABC transporter permease [Deinococcales bacterium]|nr:ABC transporter permease [Deinococcales bacterium]